MIRRALLLLTASERAVFSQQPRTEGEHRTLSHPPGSTLLGWAARNYDHWLNKGKAEAIFHSGRVRFSDALPLTADGAPAYPVPQILMEPKHRPPDTGGLSKAVRVGRAAADDDDDVQYDGKKDGYVTRAGILVDPGRGGRLRTATHKGRADRGRLFGLQHLEPERRRWAATLEAD